MDFIDAINLAGSVVSIVLGVLAIAISIYFYRQSKDSEAKVQIALEGIKAQTEALQSLSSRYLDRLTKYVTTTPRDNPNSSSVVEALDRLPDQIRTAVSILVTPSFDKTEALVQEVVNSYVALLYYIGLTNVWASLNLPAAEEFDENNELHKMVKAVVDRSYNDFLQMEKVVFSIDQQKLKGSTFIHLLGELGRVYRPLIKDTAQTFARRAKAEEE